MITIEEACKRLNYKKSFVCRLCRLGELKATRFGRAWAVDEDSVSTYVRKPRGKPKGYKHAK